MNKDEKSFKQILLLSLAVIGFVVLVELSFWAFSAYQANKALEDIVGDIQRVSEANQAKARAYQRQFQAELKQKHRQAERQREKKFNQDTYCVVNSDTNKCVCIHRKTGRRISVQHEECLLRVSGK